jgi:hypothetical protein
MTASKINSDRPIIERQLLAVDQPKSIFPTRTSRQWRELRRVPSDKSKSFGPQPRRFLFACVRMSVVICSASDRGVVI